MILKSCSFQKASASEAKTAGVAGRTVTKPLTPCHQANHTKGERAIQGQIDLPPFGLNSRKYLPRQQTNLDQAHWVSMWYIRQKPNAK